MTTNFTGESGISITEGLEANSSHDPSESEPDEITNGDDALNISEKGHTSNHSTTTPKIRRKQCRIARIRISQSSSSARHQTCTSRAINSTHAYTITVPRDRHVIGQRWKTRTLLWSGSEFKVSPVVQSSGPVQ